MQQDCTISKNNTNKYIQNSSVGFTVTVRQEVWDSKYLTHMSKGNLSDELTAQKNHGGITEYKQTLHFPVKY